MSKPQLSYLLCCVIASRISFTSTAATNSSSLCPRTSYTYCLDSGLPSTWYNNNSISMEGGAKMRVLMVIQDYNRGIGFYCGFYSAENLRYSFSVVAVGGNSHDVVWSAQRGLSVGPEASLQLSRDRGLVLREKNGTEVWFSSSEDKKAVAGMNLTGSGNLILFGDEGSVLWQSFDNVSDTLLVGQRLLKGRNLVPDPNYQRGFSPFVAKLVSARNFSTFFDVGDGRSVMYYGLGLDGNARTRYGLEYKEGIVENVGTFSASSSDLLESIGFVKLGTDGHLKMYSYKASGSVRQVVDMFDVQCEASVGGYLMDEARNITYTANNNVITSVKTPNDCKKACLRSCSCSAAFFRPRDGKCHMPSEIYMGNNANRGEEISFIRLLNPNGVPIRSISWAARHRKALAAGGASIAAVMILVFAVMWRKNKKDEDIDKNLNMVTGMPLRFSYEALQTATENFKESLGSGGFGSVFKGVLEDGTGIAVKRLEKLSQGVREFLAEVETIGSLHHFNLVRLLVYEHMTNGSLDNWIFDRGEEECRRLDWETRKKIILGVAKGLTYLHEECRKKIIHLDIKPHNILLDGDFNAKVSDFGLSTLIGRDESQVLTKMRGTPGYLAPEWKEMRVTVKVDVYSFGIVLLEVVSKRRNVESSRSETSFHLLKMLQRKAEEDRIIEIVENMDEDMIGNIEEVTRMIKIGAWCLQDDPEKRPSMSTVVKAIEGVTEVDENIRFKFSHALASSVSVSKNYNHITVAPQPSFLSAPR